MVRLSNCEADRVQLPVGVRVSNFYPRAESVSFVFVLSCIISGGGPDIPLATDSGRPNLFALV